MTTGAPPQTATPAVPDPGNTPPSLRACRYLIMVTTAAPLIFMRRLGLQSMTRTLPYTSKYNSSPIVTGLYKYSTQYLTVWAHHNAVLAKYNNEFWHVNA
jgi:hypothetical protein